MKSLDQIIEKYTEDHEEFVPPEHKVVSLSARVSLHSKIKLDILSELFQRKITPLTGEIIEASVSEIFEKVELPVDLEEVYARRMSEAGFEGWSEGLQEF